MPLFHQREQLAHVSNAAPCAMIHAGAHAPTFGVYHLCYVSGITYRCITRDTVHEMGTVNVRDLRNHGGEVLARVEAGEQVTVVRSGRPVAELTPLPRKSPDPATLLQRWRRLPHVDPAALRRDLDTVIDPSL